MKDQVLDMFPLGSYTADNCWLRDLQTSTNMSAGLVPQNFSIASLDIWMLPVSCKEVCVNYSLSTCVNILKYAL